MLNSRRKCYTIEFMDSTNLRRWYRDNHRPLPWRSNRDAYRIWISETMLQQTTVTAVLPYYERFLQRFPDVKSLANARVEEVLELWSGLGYYSRARNLHRAAVEIHRRGNFPETVAELSELPGFGPYTSRAVASLAFGAPVGVLDGNVIRVLSRHENWRAQWWRPAVRRDLQRMVDTWAEPGPSHEINQALMELGATVCTPKSPTCWLCPLQMSCAGRAKKTISKLPLPKPRRARLLVLWTLQLAKKKNKIALVPNSYLPFLKGQWVPPGRIKNLGKRPKTFDFRHSITHYDIYIHLAKSNKKLPQARWIDRSEIGKWAQTSVVRKILERI